MRRIRFVPAPSRQNGATLVVALLILVLIMMIGITVNDTTLGTTIANLGMTDVRFPKPVFHGDTLHVRTKVMSLRESKSRPNAGIVTFHHQGFNQRGEEVCTTLRQALMLRKPQ